MDGEGFWLLRTRAYCQDGLLMFDTTISHLSDMYQYPDDNLNMFLHSKVIPCNQLDMLYDEQYRMSICVRDRVRVVSGEQKGVVGRIDNGDTGEVHAELQDIIFTVSLSLIEREFHGGDMVAIRRGDGKGRWELVAESADNDGYVELILRNAHEQVRLPAVASNTADEILLNIQFTAHVRNLQFYDLPHRFGQIGDASALHSILQLAPNYTEDDLAALDLTLQGDSGPVTLESLRNHKDLFIGQCVSVIAGHYKGYHGLIKESDRAGYYVEMEAPCGKVESFTLEQLAFFEYIFPILFSCMYAYYCAGRTVSLCLSSHLVGAGQ